MFCCLTTANSKWYYVPGWQDCHTPLATCLKQAGLPATSAPGGRMGPCDSCWIGNPFPNVPFAPWPPHKGGPIVVPPE
jgi:hypothetical protein